MGWRVMRRPLRFTVTVDGRPFGEPFTTSVAAQDYAEQVQSEAPWAYVEVITGF